MVPYGIMGGLFLYVVFVLTCSSALVRNDFLVGFICVIMIMAIGGLFRRETNGAMGDFSVTVAGIVYVCMLFLFVVRIRFLEDGLWKLFLFLGAIKTCDIGAYFCGTLLGSKKLSPRLSPKKTVEGAVGGLVVSITFTYALNYFFGIFDSFIMVSAFGVSVAVLAQVGDLVESLFKRDANATHSGRLFPGLGGMLDIIDSALLSAPVAYFFLK
jgi:phosphatidate cytidylyltransferase